MGPQQQQFAPWYYNPYMLGPTAPFGQVVPQTQVPQQTQATSQSQTPTYTRGRVVETDTDIKPNEVPMDGTVVLFPKSDFSCVYGKTWTQDGLLKSMKFIPEPVNIPQAESETPTEQFSADMLSDLIQQIVQDKLQSALEPINTTQTQILEELKKKPVSSLIIPAKE